MQRNAWLALVVLVSVLVVALPVTAQQVTLQYWQRNWKPEVDATTEIIERFEAAHPNIKIERTLVDLGEWEAKIRVARAGGIQIDLLDVGSVPAMVRDGFLLPLDRYVQEDPEWWEDVAPPYRQYLTHEGQIYAGPWQDHSRAILYNKNLMDRAGIVPPDTLGDAWTWDEAIDAAKKVTQKQGDEVNVWGLLTPFRWSHESRAGNFTWFMWQYGADVLNEDRTKVTFNSDGAKQALELVHSWFYEHQISPPVTGPQPDYPGDYVNGRVAMVIEGNWAIANFGFQDHISATALPQGPVAAAPSGGWKRGVASWTEHPDEAWTFLKFLTDTESLVTLHEYTGHLASRVSVVESLYDKLMAPPFRVFQEQALQIGRSGIEHPAVGRVMGPLNDAVIAVLENKKAPGPALDDAAEQAQSILDEWHKTEGK